MPEYSDDLGEFFDPDLVLPMRGKKYRITSPTAAHGLRLRKLFARTDQKISDAEELAEVMQLLGAEEDPKTGIWSGGTWAEMEAAGLTWEEILHAGRTALMHFGMSKTLAQVQWHTGVGDMGNPKPPAPKSASGARSSSPAKRRAAKKPTSPSRARTAKTTPAAPRLSPS